MFKITILVKKYRNIWFLGFTKDFLIKLTAANKQVFSRRAPTHPVKPITNVTVPKTI